MREEADRRRLQSFVWPDQIERLELLQRAIDAASKLPIEVVPSTAGDFVDEVLRDQRPGEITVIYHSIMWLYVPSDEREHITEAINAAGRRATAESLPDVSII